MARLSSRDIKLAVMAWLRFGKKLPLVCTEVGPWNADVLGLSERMSVEVEVKTSREDLVREFEAKADKHYLYVSGRPAWHIPNYFYLAMPANLASKVSDIVQEKAPKAGLVAYSGKRHWNPSASFKVIVRPTKLHSGVPQAKLVHQAVMRMSSELIGLYTAVEQLKGDQLDDIRNSVVAEIRRLSCALDVEDPEADLEQRAADLALAVESIQPDDFQALGSNQKNKWKQAALYLLGFPTENRAWPLRYQPSEGP